MAKELFAVFPGCRGPAVSVFSPELEFKQAVPKNTNSLLVI